MTVHYLKIDEEGFLIDEQGLRIQDVEYGRSLLCAIARAPEQKHFVTKYQEHSFIVEAFDEPYVALQIDKNPWRIHLPYGFEANFELESLSLDPWDRFHGVTQLGVPFVLSRAAQARFFDLLDEFDDQSITADQKRYEMPNWLSDEKSVESSEFWSRKYQSGETRWDLGSPNEPLRSILPRLKLPKSRILVLGSGNGHDAALLAKMGHLVTAVDFSPEAISNAKRSYGEGSNLHFVLKDVFDLDATYMGAFDIVFEHTCFCAIAPHRREALIQVWRRVLIPGGHLLGIFLAVDHFAGPPFGSSEWEIRERLRKSFQFLYWQRCRDSMEHRRGSELLIYAQKR